MAAGLLPYKTQNWQLNFTYSHCNENSIFVYSQTKNCAVSVPISTFMCLLAIYIFLQQNRQTDLRNI
jgi:hypothetical protein